MNALHFLTVGTLLTAFAAGDDAAKAELKKLQGTWTLERLDYAGKDVTDKYKLEIAVKDGVLAVAGDKVAEDYGRSPSRSIRAPRRAASTSPSPPAGRRGPSSRASTSSRTTS